jgi:PhzF family phenazine biosynthesis protein
MSLTVRRVDAFTRDGRGGNPAGVVLDGGALDATQMQAIAATLGYSETAFLVARTGHAFSVRFFAPSKEVAICGHATVALFHTLKTLHGIDGQCLMHCGVGELQVQVTADMGILLAQKSPQVEGPLEASLVADALGIDVGSLSTDIQAHRVASTGLKKIFAEVTSREILNGLAPDRAALTALSESQGAIGVYIYTKAGPTDHADWYCRNYAPLVGIWDDAATGTSAAALTGVLADRGITKQGQGPWIFFQGDPIDTPSRIDTQWQGDELWVGGQASIAETFELKLESL